jgi:type IV secretion system protein VirB4
MPLKAQAASSALSREVPGDAHIPFVAHVDPWTLKTANGDYVQTFRMEGLAHETAHIDEIEVWHEQLALVMRNVNSPNLALWAYVDRRQTGEYVAGEFEPGFARDLNDKYRASLAGKRLFVNELYLAIVYRPEWRDTVRAVEKADPAFRDKHKLLNKQNLSRNSNGVERVSMVASEIEKNLRRYGPEKLGRYALDRRTKREFRGDDFSEAPDDALLFSDALEFYGRILNGEESRVPFLRSNVQGTLQTSRITFGRETIELRGPATSTFGAMLAWKEYADPSFPGQMNELLRAPFEFTLAQSFTCLDKAAARGALKRQRARMESTEDDAIGEVEALTDAVEGLASNQFAFGVHHLALMVRSRDIRELPNVVAEARRVLSDSGAVVVREDLGCEPAFYSMLAANFGDRTRPSEISSRNFIGFASMHNYPSGKRDGNHWGPALALLKTASGAPYYFSLHRRDIGHFAVYGSTGAGKTVFVCFLLTMLIKTKATVIYFDKDRGAELAVRANRGQYFALKRGVSTGLNPFQLEATPNNIAFVQQLIRIMLRSDKPFTASENNQIDRAVAGVFALDSEHRRLAYVLQFLEPPKDDNIAARLLRWVNSDRGVGPLAWVFDNDVDELDLERQRLCGIDITYFLDDGEIRTPMLAYLFHRIDLLKDGRRGGVIIDEGWKALDDEFFVPRIADGLKTDRKKDWFLGLITQSPQDSLRTKIAHTITEQTPTKIGLPNLNAKHADYVDGLGFTEGEYEQVRTLSESGRRMLVKQGENSVICELDLGGFEDELAVLSGTAATVAILDRVREQVGDNPDDWLPAFHAERKKK